MKKQCSTCGYYAVNGRGFYKGHPHCQNPKSPKHNQLVSPDKACCDLHASMVELKAERICALNSDDAILAISHVKRRDLAWAVMDFESFNKKRHKVLSAAVAKLKQLKKDE